MDDAEADFQRLMERVRAGCPEAQREVFERYCQFVRRVVRRRLRRQLRRRYDSDDFTQAVWASFFQVPTEQFVFPTSEDLIAFLGQMADNKVKETTRKRLGTRRHRSAYAQSLDAPNPNEDGPVGEAVPMVRPTPSQTLIADERWQRLIQGLAPGHRRILELLRDGYSSADIIRMLPNVNRKAIEKLIERLSCHLETL